MLGPALSRFGKRGARSRSADGSRVSLIAALPLRHVDPIEALRSE